MTESHTNPHDPPPAPELPALTAPPRAGKKILPGPWLATGLAMAALLGVVLLSWLVWQGSTRIETTRQELSRRLADSETAQREAQATAKQNREALDALQAKVGALDARGAEMQSQQLALETMYQEVSRGGEDRLLVEIEQEVAIAAQQLQLAGNVEAALIALQNAEARLARNAQPQFLPLRKLMVRDIERLKAMPGADVPGIALKLDAIQNAVPHLSLAFEQRPAPTVPAKAAKKFSSDNAAAPAATAPPGQEKGLPAVTSTVDWQAALADWQAMSRGWLADLWQELRQLVHVERLDRPDPGLLSPRETFFLRENLRLRLLSARLALLARDGRSFQSDLKQAEQWLSSYFDTQSPAVQETLVTLKSLGRLDVMREPLEINETLAALRNFKLARDRKVR